METNNNNTSDEHVKANAEIKNESVGVEAPAAGADETEEEFYDVDDIVDLVEKRFGTMNLEKASASVAPLEGQGKEDEDFVSLPHVNVDRLKDLEDKVREMEKEDEKRETDPDEPYDGQSEDDEDKEKDEVNFY